MPTVTVDVAGRGWRLNSARWTGDPLSTQTDMLRQLFEQITAECGPWNGAAHRFLARYLATIETMIAQDAVLLEKRLAAYRGLFTPRDFRFSAPRPLPRAHLPVGPAGATQMVDLAFFPGDGRCVALLGRGALTPRRQAERRELLTAAGVHIADIEAPNAIDLVLGPKRFWEDEVLPCGPLRPMAIPLRAHQAASATG